MDTARTEGGEGGGGSKVGGCSNDMGEGLVDVQQ